MTAPRPIFGDERTNWRMALGFFCVGLGLGLAPFAVAGLVFVFSVWIGGL